MFFINTHLKPGEKPTIFDIIDEVDMGFINPMQTAYRLLAEDVGRAEAECLLYVTLSHWDRFTQDFALFFGNHRPERKEDVLEDNPLWGEYERLRKEHGDLHEEHGR